MATIIEAEARNSDTERKKRWHKQKGKSTSKAKASSPISEDDAEYIGSLSEDSSSSDEGDKSDEVEISNKEVILFYYLITIIDNR